MVEVSTVTIKSVTLQHNGESDSVNSTSLYRHGEVCVSAARRCQSVSELSDDSVNSAVPDGEVFYSKFSVKCIPCKVIYGLVT